jgi:hypothetical protein
MLRTILAEILVGDFIPHSCPKEYENFHIKV